MRVSFNEAADSIRGWVRIGGVAALVLAAFLPAAASASSCQSNAPAGQVHNWSDSASWSSCNNRAPQTGDTATILSGHVITLDTATNVISGLTINSGGSLLSTGGNRRINIKGTLLNNGSLDIRSTTTRDNYINASGGDLMLSGSASSVWYVDYLNLNWDSTNILFKAGDSFTLNLTGDTPFQGIYGSKTINSGGNSTATVVAAQAGTQTLSTYGVTYPHLVTSGSGAKTFDTWTTATILGNLTIGAGTTLDGSSGASLAGNLTISGTLVAATTRWTLNGTSPQTISAPASFRQLTLNNSQGLTLNGDLTVTSNLNLTAGRIATNAYKVILGTSGNACTSGLVTRSVGAWVNGNVAMNFTGGAYYGVDCTFPVGDSGNYAPIRAVVYDTGWVIGYTTAGDHADTTAGLSGVDPAHSANRSWTLATGGIAISNAYTATFSFCNTAGSADCLVNDVDAGSTTGSFIVTEYTASAWTPVTVGTRGSTSTAATGLTALGTFAVGQPAPISLDHVRLEYSSTACTGNDTATVVVKACENSSCTSLVQNSFMITLTSANAFVQWPNGSNTIAVAVSGGSETQTLTATWAQSTTLSGTVTGYTTSVVCSTGGSEAACGTLPITFSTCSFDVVESGKSANTPVNTKLSGTAFSLDLVSINTSTTVSAVDIVDATTSACTSTTYTALASGTPCSGSLPMSIARNARQCFNFNYAGSVRNAKMRVKFSAWPYYNCSSDNFAVRPTSGFTLTSTKATGTDASATTKLRAGAGTFDLVATPVAALTSFAGPANLTTAGFVLGGDANQTAGTVAGASTLAADGSGHFAADGFTYSEVGTFSLAAGAVDDGGWFANVDAVKSPAECNVGSASNSLSGGLYGCAVGSSASGVFGRFYPDHFSVTGTLLPRSDLLATTGTINAGSSSLTVGSSGPIAVGKNIVVVGAGKDGIPLQTTVSAVSGTTVTLAAAATTSVVTANVYAYSSASLSGFTYMNEPMLLLQTITALNGAATPATTVNYAKSTGYAKLAASGNLGIAAANTSPALPSGRLTSSGASGDWVSGVGTFAVPLTVSRASAPDGPYDSLNITAAPVDSDGVTVSSAASLATTKSRYGRIRLFNRNGSELLDLPLTMNIEYWAGDSSGWQKNTLDTLTLISASNFALDFPASTANHLAACETAISVGGSAPSYSLSLSKPGAGNDGWADVTLNLGSAAVGKQCSAVGGAGAADVSLNMPWLQFSWRTVGLDNPTARARFGGYRSGPVIHRRELF
jgi:hypothetical protein